MDQFAPGKEGLEHYFYPGEALLNTKKGRGELMPDPLFSLPDGERKGEEI